MSFLEDFQENLLTKKMNNGILCISMMVINDRILFFNHYLKSSQSLPGFFSKKLDRFVEWSQFFEISFLNWENVKSGPK